MVQGLGVSIEPRNDTRVAQAKRSERSKDVPEIFVEFVGSADPKSQQEQDQDRDRTQISPVGAQRRDAQQRQADDANDHHGQQPHAEPARQQLVTRVGEGIS